MIPHVIFAFWSRAFMDACVFPHVNLLPEDPPSLLYSIALNGSGSCAIRVSRFLVASSSTFPIVSVVVGLLVLLGNVGVS